MTGIIFAFLAAVFIAVAQVELKKSFKELKPSVAFFFDAVFGLLLWAPLALFMGVSFGISWQEAIFYATVSAILSEAIVFYALSRGQLAITATVLATYPVYTVFFSVILNDEKLTLPLFISIMLAVAGSVWATREEDKTIKRIHTSDLLWPFIAAVSIGLSDTISKGYINRSDDYSLLFALAFVQVPVAVAYLRIEKQNFKSFVTRVYQNISDYYHALLGGFFNIVGTGFLWLSLYFAPASIASPITGFSGALTVLLARFALSEKLSTKKYLAILVALVGVIGIAVFRE